MRYGGLTIEHDELMEARRGSARRPQTVPRWAQRLAANRWLATHEVHDLLHDVTPLPSGQRDGTLVTRLTGMTAEELLHHPGPGDSTFGGLYYPSFAVAVTLVLLARLGANVDALTLTDPLRRRLARKRDYPLLTPSALTVLWARKENRGVHRFTWAAEHGISPYALELRDGRTVAGFADPDGCRVEVIGRRGLYPEACRGGWMLGEREFRRLVRSARPVEAANVIELSAHRKAASKPNPTPPEAA